MSISGTGLLATMLEAVDLKLLERLLTLDKGQSYSMNLLFSDKYDDETKMLD